MGRVILGRRTEETDDHCGGNCTDLISYSLHWFHSLAAFPDALLCLAKSLPISVRFGRQGTEHLYFYFKHGNAQGICGGLYHLLGDFPAHTTATGPPQQLPYSFRIVDRTSGTSVLSK